MRRRLAAYAVLGALLLTSCGVPDDQSVEVVPSERVPYGLLEVVTPTPTTAEAGTPRPGRPTVYFVRDEQLVGTALTAGAGGAGDSRTALEEVVAALSAGPGPEARAEGVGTAVPTSLQLLVEDVTDEVATIDLAGEEKVSIGEEAPLATGQIVLSATSVPGVSAVLLTRQGEPVDAQEVDGALTADPLTGQDFASLVSPGGR